MKYKFSEISTVLQGRLILSKDLFVSYAFIDSRGIIPVDKCIFFAIRGKRNDGHLYIRELINKGVRNFVVENLDENLKKYKKCNFLVVSDSLKAFQNFSAWHRQHFQIPVVGITGSNGKTIVKEWLYHLLCQEMSIVRSPKSYNSQVGVPLSVLLTDNHHQMGIFEAGISQPGEMHKLEKIIRPTVGIFTNIGSAHQENFIDYQQKILEKLQLFKNSKKIIYCADNELIEKNIIEFSHQYGLELFSWSAKKAACLMIKKTEITNKHTEISVIHNNRKIKITIPFTDSASVENAIQVLAFLLSENRLEPESFKRFRTLPGIGMRLELMNGINQCTIINDTYNSDINSIKIALEVLKRQNQHKQKCLILSDVLQSGEKEPELYANLEKIIRKSDIQKFIAIGPQISKHYPGTKSSVYFFDDTRSFLKSEEIKRFNNEAILIKGARDFKFEEISEALQQKTHRTVLEINLEALENNLNYFKSLLQPKTKIMVMVKAFSYGSGSYEIASFLEHQKVDYLGVAFADEGVALRKAGITIPVIVMNPEEGSFESIINYGLEPEIYSFRSLDNFARWIKNSDKQSYPVHIKIDTGMKRLGFLPAETDELIVKLKQYPFLLPKSIFSHLAASEDSNFDDYSAEQIALFDKIAGAMQKKYKHHIIKHILNSSGIERFAHAQYDMVRLGIGLYGISSQKNVKLENISTLKSHITQIKWVRKHETVGYGRKGILEKDSKIAIIPLGYADGLNRKLGNRIGRAFIHGSFALITGNICMDMCMLDITDIEAREGDEVIFFGKEIPVTELADKTGTIPYEILTGISQRVKRVYIH